MEVQALHYVFFLYKTAPSPSSSVIKINELRTVLYVWDLCFHQFFMNTWFWTECELMELILKLNGKSKKIFVSFLKKDQKKENISATVHTVWTLNKALEMLHTIKKTATRNSQPMKNNVILFKEKLWKNSKIPHVKVSQRNISTACKDFFMRFFSKSVHQRPLTKCRKPRPEWPSSSRGINEKPHFLPFFAALSLFSGL